MYLHMSEKIGLVGENFTANVAGALARVDLHMMVQAGAEFKPLVAQVTLVQRGQLMIFTAPVVVA
jgi:hypothetical protein